MRAYRLYLRHGGHPVSPPRGAHPAPSPFGKHSEHGLVLAESTGGSRCAPAASRPRYQGVCTGRGGYQGTQLQPPGVIPSHRVSPRCPLLPEADPVVPPGPPPGKSGEHGVPCGATGEAEQQGCRKGKREAPRWHVPQPASTDTAPGAPGHPIYRAASGLGTGTGATKGVQRSGLRQALFSAQSHLPEHKGDTKSPSLAHRPPPDGPGRGSGER